jgi:hypothetical protein
MASMDASLRLAPVGVAALALALLTPRPARADCAEGADYDLTVTGNTVAVCEGAAPCTPSTPFLRQDEASGDVVSFAATCDMNGCFNDECVPPGTYRYGLATAFPCSDSGCGNEVPYFEEVTVTAALSNCTRDASSPVPAPTTVAPPWGSGSDVTATLSCPGCACGTVGGDRGKALAVQALAAAAGLCAMIARRRRPRK